MGSVVTRRVVEWISDRDIIVRDGGRRSSERSRNVDVGGFLRRRFFGKSDRLRFDARRAWLPASPLGHERQDWDTSATAGRIGG